MAIIGPPTTSTVGKKKKKLQEIQSYTDLTIFKEQPIEQVEGGRYLSKEEYKAKYGENQIPTGVESFRQ